MQMRAGHATGGADFADDVTGFDMISRLHVDGAQVAVHRNETLAVIEKKGVAIEEEFPRVDYATIRRCFHRRADRRGDVHASMRIAGFIIEKTAQSERARAPALHGWL